VEDLVEGGMAMAVARAMATAEDSGVDKEDMMEVEVEVRLIL
jgi:hypothetical protein